MTVKLADLRPVFVVGVGWSRYSFLSDSPYVALALAAARAALSDAGAPWESIESAYVARALLPMAAGRPIFRHLGDSAIPIVHIENASASGSSAVRQAAIEVAAGVSDVSIVLGVDKPAPLRAAEGISGPGQLAGGAMTPAAHFALLADEYIRRHQTPPEDIARVAVKNHCNAALNAFAQHQKLRTLDEILASKPIAGILTSLQCTPIGEGAAAVVIASDDGIGRWGLDGDRAVRIAASAARSQHVYARPWEYDALLTHETVSAALGEAGVTARDLDLIELHDAFTIEELLYLEAMGISGEGDAVGDLKNGDFDIGGRCAVNASGGLIAMGHPVGPTGVGQIGQIVMQIRGEAGARQHPNAKVGLAHMVGLGAVCCVHVLQGR